MMQASLHAAASVPEVAAVHAGVAADAHLALVLPTVYYSASSMSVDKAATGVPVRALLKLLGLPLPPMAVYQASKATERAWASNHQVYEALAVTPLAVLDVFQAPTEAAVAAQVSMGVAGFAAVLSEATAKSEPASLAVFASASSFALLLQLADTGLPLMTVQAEPKP